MIHVKLHLIRLWDPLVWLGVHHMYNDICLLKANNQSLLADAQHIK